jgi:hypothetical protein
VPILRSSLRMQEEGHEIVQRVAGGEGGMDNGFTGSSLSSLAPRHTYVTYHEVLNADKEFFDLVEKGKVKEALAMIRKYNGHVLKSNYGGHIQWIPPEPVHVITEDQRVYKEGEGIGGWHIPETPTHASQRLLPSTLRKQLNPDQIHLDLNGLSINGETALMIAARNGDVNMVCMLIFTVYIHIHPDPLTLCYLTPSITLFTGKNFTR